MTDKELDEPKKPQPQVDFKAHVLGTYRTSGALIVLLLSLEPEEERADILASVCNELGIPVQDVMDHALDKTCSRCGMSLLLHRQNGGKCF